MKTDLTGHFDEQWKKWRPKENFSGSLRKESSKAFPENGGKRLNEAKSFYGMHREEK
jgi:hypothetical protein